MGKLNETCHLFFGEDFAKNNVKINMFILSIFVLLRTPYEFKLKNLVDAVNSKNNHQRFSNICKSLLSYEPHLTTYSVDHFRREIMMRMIEKNYIENNDRKYAKTIHFFDVERNYKKYM